MSFLIARPTLIAVILLAGCTQIKFLPPSPELRAQLGPTAVVAAPAKPSLDIGREPVSGSGSGALLGAGEGASAGLPVAQGGCSSGNSLSCAVGLVLGAAVAVVAAPVGAVVGAINAHSAEEVRLAGANLQVAFTEEQASVTSRLRDRVVAAARGLPAYRLSAYSPEPEAQPAKAPVAHGFDSRLEITVTGLKLSVAGRIDPDATVLIVAEARLVHNSNATDLYRRTWAYVGSTRNYFKEAGENAGLLRQEIDAGLDKLATRIVSDLFVSTSPEVQKTSSDPGTVYTVAAWTGSAGRALQPPAPNSPANPTGTASTVLPAGQAVASAVTTGATTPAISTVSSGPVDVPFKIDFGAGVAEGVAKLENGHLIGQASNGGRPITLEGTLKNRKLSIEVNGAIIGNAQAAAGGFYCSGNAELDIAAGPVTIPLNATCGGYNFFDRVYLELPAT